MLPSHNVGLDQLCTTTETSEEEDDPEVSTTTVKALEEEAEDTTRPSERLGFWVLTTTVSELTE